MLANKPLDDSINDNLKLKDLYKENIIGIKTNISKCDMHFENDKLIASFLGYVIFVFLQDFSDECKTNDYLMLTFDIKNIELEIDDENCSLSYKSSLDATNDNEPIPCVGFIKMRSNGGNDENMLAISDIDTNIDGEAYNIPKNSHNLWRFAKNVA